MQYQITVEEFTPPTPTPGPRPPMALRGPGLASARRQAQTTSGGKAVEFVIVLELKAKPK